MSLLIGFLTFILVMNCLFLMLLILIQLPKKEAGAGIAFGGAATDALFGAGSGNALTRLTKYAGTFFVVLAVTLSILHMRVARDPSRRIERELARQASAPAAVTPVPAATTSEVRTFTSKPELAPALMSATSAPPVLATPPAEKAEVPAVPAQP